MRVVDGNERRLTDEAVGAAAARAEAHRRAKLQGLDAKGEAELALTLTPPPWSQNPEQLWGPPAPAEPLDLPGSFSLMAAQEEESNRLAGLMPLPSLPRSASMPEFETPEAQIRMREARKERRSDRRAASSFNTVEQYL